MSRNSITPSRAFFTVGVRVLRLPAARHWARAEVVDRQRAGRLRLRHALHLDKAHPAIAGDRQPFVIAKARHFGARQFAGLQQCRPFSTSISIPSILSFGITTSGIWAGGPSAAAMSSSSVRSSRTSLIITVSGAWPRDRQPSPSWKLHSMIQASFKPVIALPVAIAKRRPDIFPQCGNQHGLGFRQLLLLGEEEARPAMKRQ